MKLLSVLSIILLSWQAQAIPTPEQPDRAIEHYLLEDGGVGLKGYDPVAYFPEHGDGAFKGDTAISATYGGVTYFFVSEANKQEFLSNPLKYEPTYGGWCAWGMANEGYIEIDPLVYTLHGNRAHYFLSPGAKARFDRDLERRESDADEFWESETGEQPRI